MLKVKTQTYKLNRLVKDLQKLSGPKQEEAASNIARNTINRGEKYAKKGNEFKNIYGGSSHRGLRKSLTKSVKGATGKLTASAPHALIIEHGGKVRVKDYKAFPIGGGQYRMFKTPGHTHIAQIPARFWFRETRDVMSREIDEIATKEIDRMLRGAVTTK